MVSGAFIIYKKEHSLIHLIGSLPSYLGLVKLDEVHPVYQCDNKNRPHKMEKRLHFRSATASRGDREFRQKWIRYDVTVRKKSLSAYWLDYQLVHR